MNLAPVRCDDLDWDTVRSHDNKQTGLWCRNHRRLFFDGVCPGDAVTPAGYRNPTTTHGNK